MMNNKAMLKTLIETGEQMRVCQKTFINNTGKVSDEKKVAMIIESKKAEQQFDNALYNIKQLIK